MKKQLPEWCSATHCYPYTANNENIREYFCMGCPYNTKEAKIILDKKG